MGAHHAAACRSVVAVIAASSMATCATFGLRGSVPAQVRVSVLARSQVWTPTDVRAMDLKTGPPGEGAFAFRSVVRCDYVHKTFQGASPKFDCRIGADDEVKVKFGGANGEVYGEVLATRLLWALGFGADRMYPVSVICHGCPPELGGIERPDHDSRFDPAVIERKMAGARWPPHKEDGWSWAELNAVDEERGGAPRAHRDALTLLAVFMQHTDSKRAQQRIVCLGQHELKARDSCDHPFLMIADLGETFGRANKTNADPIGGVNLVAWRQTPVWKNEAGCVGNIRKSFSGTLDFPLIHEDGRRFLADLLVQLSDRQLQELFDAARVQLRLRDPRDITSGFPRVEEWVDAFKDKRRQIVERHCAA